MQNKFILYFPSLQNFERRKTFEGAAQVVETSAFLRQPHFLIQFIARQSHDEFWRLPVPVYMMYRMVVLTTTDHCCSFRTRLAAKYLPRCRVVESFRFTRMVIHNGVILQYSYYFSLVWHTLIFLPYSWFYETKFLEKKRKAKVGIKRATNGPAAIFSCLRSPVGFLQENGFIYQIVSKVPLLEISVIQE